MSLIETIKNYFLSKNIDKAEFEYSTKKDLINMDNTLIKEKKNNEYNDITNSTAYNVYQSAYSSLSSYNKEKINYNDIFNMSQDAFLLVIRNFKYTILNCSIDTKYINKIIYNKMREYNSYFDFSDIYNKYKNINVSIEFITFYDKSVIARINILDDDISKMYLSVFEKNKKHFDNFLINNNKIILDKTNDLLKEQPEDENFSTEAYKFQSDVILKMTDFTYRVSYHSFLFGFLNSVLIDINEFDNIFNNVIKYNTIEIGNNIKNIKTNQLSNKDDLTCYLKNNNIIVQKIK